MWETTMSLFKTKSIPAFTFGTMVGLMLPIFIFQYVPTRNDLRQLQATTDKVLLEIRLVRDTINDLNVRVTVLEHSH